MKTLSLNNARNILFYMRKPHIDRAKLGLGIILVMGGLYMLALNRILTGIILMGIGMFIIGI